MISRRELQELAKNLTVSELIEMLEQGNLQGRNFKQTWPDSENKSVIIDRMICEWELGL